MENPMCSCGPESETAVQKRNWKKLENKNAVLFTMWNLKSEIMFEYERLVLFRTSAYFPITTPTL